MWLLDYLVIRQERDALQTKCSLLEDEVSATRSALAGEIDRNREREDGLVAQICLLAKAQPPVRHQPVKKEPDTVDIVYDDAPEESEELERAVHARAREFYEQARQNGVDYDFEVLVETIKKNPDEFLDN